MFIAFYFLLLVGAPGDIQCKHWPNMEAVYKKGKTLDVYIAKNN